MSTPHPSLPTGGKARLAALAEAPAAPSHAMPLPPLARDPRFRRAWAGSVALHLILFGWALYPSETKARFYGSGTAVSLVGADQIPGGSQKGKSGDRPEALRKTKPPEKPPAKKEAGPSKEEIDNIRRIRQVQAEKERGEKAERDRKERERQARLKEIRERRAREESWRREYEARRKKEAPKPAQTARVQTPPPVGHPGEGGGDGQGGGSIGGGGGGVARTELERDYGLLGERVRNFWTVPLNLTELEKLSTTVAVDVARDGTVRGLKIERASGNKIYDEAALRAVERAASPSLPPPPNSVKETWLALGFRFCGASFCR